MRLQSLVAFALLALSVALLSGCRKKDGDDFTRLTNLGKSQLEGGDPLKAADYFQRAAALQPTQSEARLNLANAYLRANQTEAVLQQTAEVLRIDPNSAPAYYLAGCAHLRAGHHEEALKAFQQSQRLDPAVTALNFHLGLAHERLEHFDEALQQYRTVIEFEPDHAAAHYRIGQILLRTGQAAEANQALQQHAQILARIKNVSTDPSFFERCKHTVAKLPFKLEQPLPAGIKVTFTDATSTQMPGSPRYAGPIAVVDFARDGRNHLFVRDEGGFRLLLNSNGQFHAAGAVLPSTANGRGQRALVGDLQNDQTEDVLIISDQGSQVFKFTTNGTVTDVTRPAGLGTLSARAGVLLDFDYTGKLGVLAVRPDPAGIRPFRNLSSTFALYFSDQNLTSGLPTSVTGAAGIVLDDWNNDELVDVAITRTDEPPLAFYRERGGPFVSTNWGQAWPKGAVALSVDLNNDSLPDWVSATSGSLQIIVSGQSAPLVLPAAELQPVGVGSIDYDNDGWLDLCAWGHGLRLWRNRGALGWQETTSALGLESLKQRPIESPVFADLDGDCDTDMVVAVEGSIRILRNDGGNQHHQLKLRLAGHRSNASALGVRYELNAGGLRAWRMVRQLPIEIGTGKHAQVDSLGVRWFDGFINHDEIKLTACTTLTLDEIEKPTGSCPYLYVWDGQRFRFVTDLLGAAPLGLPLSNNRYVDADPYEQVWIGDDTQFAPRNGVYSMQITEELREVLYLDEAKLLVVDHPPEVEVHTTGKLRPGKPFPRPELISVHLQRPLLGATNQEGEDRTSVLSQVDGRMASPAQLRTRQLRGLAQPHSVTLDFGVQTGDKPWVLVLNGWLRFGGGMANVAASHTPDLPFPFPQLEAETPSGKWVPVDVVVGAPAGKTKTIVVELEGKLPESFRRLRLTTAFEIHWDRVALFEKEAGGRTRVVAVSPTRTDLHWRGYSEFEAWPWYLPLSPNYERSRSTADWTITPAGWCTRYGEVDELIAAADDAMALLNGGDELTLEFAEASLPARVPDLKRGYFLYTVGWDKDADFHCALGRSVEPLPYRGMDSQKYGSEPSPVGGDWMKKYNTRWVGPRTLTQEKRGR